MRFVADVTKEKERAAVLRQRPGTRLARPIDLLLPLGESEEVEAFDIELVEDGERGVQLPATSVDEDEIGKLRELAAGDCRVREFGKAAAEPAAKHLAHHGDVVRLARDVDLEAAVRVAPRPSALEHDHRPRGFLPLGVRNVECLDALRERRERETLGELHERFRGFLTCRILLLAGLEGEARVLVRERHERALVATLRHDEAHSAAALGGKPRSECRRVVHVAREKDFPGDRRRLAVVLSEERFEHVCGLGARGGAKVERLPCGEAAFADEEHLRAGTLVAERESDRIPVEEVG